MKCEELLALLNDYVDGTVDASLCEEFQRHMAGCDSCKIVVDNIRKTITLYRSGVPCEMPQPLRSRLHECLQRRWSEMHPSTSTGQ